MAMFNRLTEKDKGSGARLFFLASWSCFSVSGLAIPNSNRGSSYWITFVITLCVGFIWVAGRKYLRITIALLILAFSIVLTFGLFGVQQTTSARINAWGHGDYYLQYTDPDAPLPGYDTITAPVSGPDTMQFALYDEVTITYRKVSLFGFLHLATYVDSIDAAPVIGTGSRHVTASHAWLTVFFGTLPIVSLSGLYLYKRYHPGKRLAVET